MALNPLIPGGERVMLDTRASWWAMLTWNTARLVLAGAMTAVVAIIERSQGRGFGRAAWLMAAFVIAWVLVNALERAFARYVITDRRVVTRRGVVARTVVDLLRDRIQHAGVRQSFVQRLLGVGDVYVSSAGVDAPTLVLASVDSPMRVLEVLRKGAEASSNARPTLVLGLVGGVGSGKSSVARVLESLGCVVLDADKAAKAALDREEVRARLVEWWGSGVISATGLVDRAAVAKVIFNDPAQRRRLESLIHPIVLGERAPMIETARRDGRPAVVIDAPLLFEAGSDRGCDAVIFVDAPREQRLERVRSRGWEESELARREAAQLPLEAKRSRSRYVIVNDAGLEELEDRVQSLFLRIQDELNPNRPMPVTARRDGNRSGGEKNSPKLH
jgi:dephospho-CoA kinase